MRQRARNRSQSAEIYKPYQRWVIVAQSSGFDYRKPVAFICRTPLQEAHMDAKIERIQPQEAQWLVEQGAALLICAYDDSHCKEIMLKNALLRSELESKIPAAAMNTVLIFYCA